MKKLITAVVASATVLLAAPAAAAEALPPIDWDREFTPITVLDDWTVESCEGDAPFVCVTDADGEHLGLVEHLSYDTDLRTRRELRAHVREFYDVIAADRAAGCGEDYRVVPRPVFTRRVAGRLGVSYGFTGYKDGVAVERTYGVMVLKGGKLHVVSAGAYDDGGCLAREAEFTVAGLRAFEPVLRALAAVTPVR